MTDSRKIFSFLVSFAMLVQANIPYQPTWESLDQRPLPHWYDEAKLGLFIHWGVFSVPGYGNFSEWLWWWWQGEKQQYIVDFMKTNYPPNFAYADFAQQFRAEFFDPVHWAQVIKASGARYSVFTSKHHEGFCNWPSDSSFNWNAQAVGPRRDLVGELQSAMQKQAPEVHFGLYHSLLEWFNPLYQQDVARKYSTQDFVRTKAMPELYDLVDRYKPDLIWSDGDWGATSEYWNSTEFLAWLYNQSPVRDRVVTNDRWGDGCYCKHGGFYTCKDKFQPGHLVEHKWESCYNIDKLSWGYRRNARLADFYTIEEIIAVLVETVAFGGNLLLNWAPDSSGMMSPIFEERLLQLGAWLAVNGEAIYETKPFASVQRDSTQTSVFYTQTNDLRQINLILLEWPDEQEHGLITVDLFPELIKPGTRLELIAEKGIYIPLKYTRNMQNSSRVDLDLTTDRYGWMSPRNSCCGWTIRISSE